MSGFGLSNLGSQKPPLIKAFPCYLFNLLLLLLSTLSLDFVAIDNVHVVFFLAPLYYWIIHNPMMMPLWFIFLGGLYIDFSVDGMLGLHAFSFVAYYLALYRVRRIALSQPFLYQFCVYAATAVGFEVLRWIMLSLLEWTLWPFFPSLVSVVINIVVFPVIVLVLKLLHRIMSGYGR